MFISESLHVLKQQAQNPHQKKKVSCLIGIAGAIFLTLCMVITLTSGVSARYTPIKTITNVEIGGINYGTFENFNDLRDLTSARKNPQENFTRVELKRTFVTPPSLSDWARKTFQTHGGLTDINLVLRTNDGQEVSRYTLKSCKPLSFAIEAADPALGGFHETIAFYVQEVAIP